MVNFDLLIAYKVHKVKKASRSPLFYVINIFLRVQFQEVILIMKYTSGKIGRVFVVRLEDGDILHGCIEKLALNEKIKAAGVIAVGGADTGSRLVTGPEKGRSKEIIPMEYMLRNVHEATGTGTIFPDKTGKPILHMHLACGRKNKTKTGCVRTGVKIWHVCEILIYEILGVKSRRKKDLVTGFELLEP